MNSDAVVEKLKKYSQRSGEYPSISVDVEKIPCPACDGQDYAPLTASMDFDYRTSDQCYGIVECKGCGLVYVNPRPKLSEIDKIYPAVYSAYHFRNIKNPIIRKARNAMQAGKAKSILSCASSTSDDLHIIDVGCGNTVLLESLRRNGPENMSLYGNDFSEEVIADVRQTGFEALEGSFEVAQGRDEQFHVIVMNQVLEHLFDVPRCLEKSYRMLKKGGALFIETPSADGLDAKMFRKRHWGGYHIPRHLQIFTARTVESALKRYGFEIEKIQYLPSPNFWTSSFRNLFSMIGFPKWITRRMSYKNILCMSIFTVFDLITRTMRPTSNMRVIARKTV